MDITEFPVYLPTFVIIGVLTFGLRAFFLFIKPQLMNQLLFKKALESVSNSLLVALVIPFTFFINGVFSPWRDETLALLIVVPIVWITKKPGLSLIFAIGIYLILNLTLNLV